MHQDNMTGDFDRQAVIANLTVANLSDVSFIEMLEILRPLVLVQVPEGTLAAETVDEARRLDFLLGRLANLHAYLRYLFSFASYQRDRLKKIGSDKADDMLKKKEALHELVEAVKMKYEAVSRMVTVRIKADESDTPDRVNYDARRAAAAPQSTAPAPAPSPAARPRSGGWGTV